MSKFDDIPADACKAISEAATSHGIPVEALFPDYATIKKGDAARRDAARALYDGGKGYDVATIAGWFGVSRVAINMAVRKGS